MNSTTDVMPEGFEPADERAHGLVEVARRGVELQLLGTRGTPGSGQDTLELGHVEVGVGVHHAEGARWGGERVVARPLRLLPIQ